VESWESAWTLELVAVRYQPPTELLLARRADVGDERSQRHDADDSDRSDHERHAGMMARAPRSCGVSEDRTKDRTLSPKTHTSHDVHGSTVRFPHGARR